MLSDQALVAYGKAVARARASIALGLISGSTLERARALWARPLLPGNLRIAQAYGTAAQGVFHRRAASIHYGGAAPFGVEPLTIDSFNKAIEINPEDAEAYYNRGVVHVVNQRYDQAIADYSRALVINPRYAASYHNRGVTYGRKGQYDKAIADFTKSIEINPRYAGAYCSRGNAYGKRGAYDQAIADYTKALEVDPNYALAYYSRGRVYFLRKEYGKSMEDVNKAQALGYKIPAEFLEDLHKASGK